MKVYYILLSLTRWLELHWVNEGCQQPLSVLIAMQLNIKFCLSHPFFLRESDSNTSLILASVAAKIANTFCSPWPGFCRFAVWDLRAAVHGQGSEQSSQGSCRVLLTWKSLTSIQENKAKHQFLSTFNEHIKMSFFFFFLFFLAAFKKHFTRGKANEGPVATAPWKCLCRQGMIFWIHGLVCEWLPQQPETISVGAHGCKDCSFLGCFMCSVDPCETQDHGNTIELDNF